nr:hypothetical protein [Tanacetum cinerariifolium]
FLKKPQGSEDFHQIVDFLNASHIRYALTENPTIYVSLINQFWRTASARTLDNGEIELNATVDGQDKTITKAFVRRHLKLADADGISTLSTTEIFKQLALMGYVTDSDKLTFHKRATTTASSLEAEQSKAVVPRYHGGSHVQARHKRLSNLPNEPPLEEEKVTTLENEHKSTKTVYNKAFITLTKRVKKLKKNLKHKRRRAVVDSSEDKEARKPLKTTGHIMESDDTKVVDFSTAGPKKDDDEITLVETLVNIKKSVAKDKGKDIMQETEPSKKIKKKMMIQISLDEEIALRFYEEEQAQLLVDEEYAQQIQAQWRYSFEEIKMLFDKTMESIRKFVPMESEGQIVYSKAREGSSKKGESLKRLVEEELGQEQQKKQKTKYLIIDWEIYTEGTRQYWKIIRVGNIIEERFSSSNPTEDKEIALWVELKRLFKPDEDDELWKFDLLKKEYPLSRGALLIMLVQKLQVDKDNGMAEELLRKIFMQAKRPQKYFNIYIVLDDQSFILSTFRGVDLELNSNIVLQNTSNNQVVNGGNNLPFVHADQIPAGITLQQLMFGSIIVIDNELTEGHELGLTASKVSHIAIIGETKKYEEAKRILALGWLLEEIHMTWDHLEKKWTRLWTNTKSLDDLCIQWLETSS